MNLKIWMRLGGILAVLLAVVPMLAVAQGYDRDRAEQRGTIQVDNDRRGAVHITVWTNRGQELGGGWRFRSGDPPSWRSARERSKSGQTTRSRSAIVRDGLMSGTLDGFGTAYGTSACGTYSAPRTAIVVMIVIDLQIGEKHRTT